MSDAGSGAEAVVRGDRAEPAEGRDEDADHARAEEPGAAVIEVVVEGAVEMLQHPAEEQRDHQEQEADGGNRQKDREGVQLCDGIHEGECAHSR